MNQATQYDVSIKEASSGPAWRAIEVRHLTPEQNKGGHAVYVDVVNEQGAKYTQAERIKAGYAIGWTWDGAQLSPKPRALDKPDTTIERGHGNIDLYYHQTLSVWIVGDGLPSDTVSGMHTRWPDEKGPNGELWNSQGHHSYYVKFQKSAGVVIDQPPVYVSWTGYVIATLGLNMRREPSTASPALTTLRYGTPVIITGPLVAGWYPATDGLNTGYLYAEYVSRTDPTSIKSDFDKAVAWVLNQEGGYTSGLPGDVGGETNFGISKNAYPNLDIKNLTRAEAIELYRRDYWQASGADALSWPMCLVHFDSAVQHGVGNAKSLLSSAGHNILRYIGQRLEFYSRIPTVAQFGPAWGRRMGDLLIEVTDG